MAFVVQMCEMEFLCGSAAPKDSESNLKLLTEGVKKYQGEKDVSIANLRLMLSK